MTEARNDSRTLMANDALVETLDGMARALDNRMQTLAADEVAMIGIHTGGVWVAEALHARMGLSEPLAALDISFYRDDFTRIGINPLVRPSQVPFDIDDRHVILVDDVIQTGRTIRAAMNEIFDFGRPASITLAILVQRSGRELPIQPDAVGLTPDLAAGEYVRLTGPDPLRLEVATERTPRDGDDR